MKDKLSAYQAWAPDDALWTPWAKPVLFTTTLHSERVSLSTEKAKWMFPPDYKTALILDLPGILGVQEGLALARLGYRPVPLYNGVVGPSVSASLVDTKDLAVALRQGAAELKGLPLRPDAPPAFLLDANRMLPRQKTPGRYDNRWCVFPQDMPSASCLLAHGITRVLVRTVSGAVQNDLCHVLRRYQERGIELRHSTKNDTHKPLAIPKPSRFRALFYRFKVISGLTRNAAGGFGGAVPDVTQTGGYHGIG